MDIKGQIKNTFEYIIESIRGKKNTVSHVETTGNGEFFFALNALRTIGEEKNSKK